MQRVGRWVCTLTVTVISDLVSDTADAHGVTPSGPPAGPGPEDEPSVVTVGRDEGR